MSDERKDEIEVLRRVVAKLVPSEHRLTPADPERLSRDAIERLTKSGCTHVVNGDYVDLTADEVEAIRRSWGHA